MKLVLNEHLRIRNTDLADTTLLPNRDILTIEDKSTNLLWIFSVWCIILFNVTISCIYIYKNYNILYNPIDHWCISFGFVSTLGGLLAINKYIRK